MVTWSSALLGTLFVVVCVLLIIVILLQKGRGGGLGAAFGGGGQSAFGTRTGDVFTWITIVLTGLFLLLAIGTAMSVRREPAPLPAPHIAPAAHDPAAIEATVQGRKIFVQIALPGEGSRHAGHTLFYTTNGNDPVPNKEGTRSYGTDPVMVEPGTTVKAMATAPGRKDSPVASVTYLTQTELEAAQQQPAPVTTEPTTEPETPPVENGAESTETP
ncbi:MAG: preprotein translocase subunit SecG [Phycisphaerae bacterium]|nr:preprotein translocase subunit SecG [Phycisphaerae bacterium]